ncbi:MAG: GDSL-type esterase/lipase family protein [Verrucomicrobiales bacterium]|nr:GDSL-type esterase/lipase family protein [Verrucomicrobiales bacterium]
MKTLLAVLFLSVFSLHGAEVINAGIGGNRTTNLLKRVEKDVLAHNPTLVVMMAGTNDRLNSGGFVTIENYIKNVENLATQIKASGASLILMTPPPCIPELLFSRHDPGKFADQSPADRMIEVRKVLLKFAAEHNIPVIDFHQYLIDNNLAGPDEKSLLKNPANVGVKDGVHLTDPGYRRLAELVAEKIKSSSLDATKVVCFGDSLTKGPGQGKDYPSVLRTLLNEAD